MRSGRIVPPGADATRPSGALASVLVAISLCGCTAAQSGLQSQVFPKVSVKATEIRPTAIEQSSEYESTLKSRQSVALYPRIEGHVTKIFVGAGAQVKARSALIEIDPLKEKSSVDSYIEAKQVASADLENASSMLRSLEASRATRLSNLKYASQQRSRYESLAAQGAVSKSDLDQWVNQAEAAQSELENVEAQIKAQQATINKLRRSVAQAEANLKSERVQLGYYTVTAPFDGTVGDIPVKFGDYVTPTTKLTTVTENKLLEAYINVPIELVSDVHIGTAVILLSQKQENIGSGKIFFIAPNVDEGNQSVLVKASIHNDSAHLRADQIVHAKIIWKTLSGFLIPAQAVSHSGGQEFVFIAEKDAQNQLVARQTPIKLGDVQNNHYQVLNGLKAGDKLVVSGIQNLTDGTPISIAVN
jgi:multidrug efflux pump subunit AcrA (membrane-fusion protein)